ncbi:MAG: RNA methyltransferase [bacterium]|nr:RNA methyltransferase [bacterium]
MNFGFNNQRRGGNRDYVKSSIPAVCGISEREVTVKTANLQQAISSLKSRGFKIVGTSHGVGPTKKVWFIRPGSL